jgi:hypothetical protein
MRRVLAAAAGAVALGGIGASAAFAGEITGPFPSPNAPSQVTPKTLWTNTDVLDAPHTLHGASECAFSGLNIPAEDGDPSRTQSYGQVVNFLKTLGVSPNELQGVPGTACNPTKSSGGE